MTTPQPIVLVFSNFEDLPLVLVFKPDCKWHDLASRSDTLIVGADDEIPSDVEQFLCTLSDVAYYTANPVSEYEKTAECAELLEYLLANPHTEVSGKVVTCGFAP